MKNLLALLFLILFSFAHSQKIEIQTLLKDDISIRAIQIWDNKVWYVGTDSKFGYVSLKNATDKKQIELHYKNLEFRTLAQDQNYFYTINIGSPAYFLRIDKKSNTVFTVATDNNEGAFYDALYFRDDNYALAFSDPLKQCGRLATIKTGDNYFGLCEDICFIDFKEGEAAFAASNTNIASFKKNVWIATGGTQARILKRDFSNCHNSWETFNTPFIQGTSSQGIYSIDFYDESFGIAVGGDYTQQSENISNIATTYDGGETWQIQASGKNAGYMTCVKIRPKSKGKDIIAVGDQHISFSSDYGKTWTKISDEKGLYACEWIDKNTLVFAGKNRIMKVLFKD